MSRTTLRSLTLLGSLLLAVAAPVAAQQRPTADQARALLQSRPDLVSQLRDRFLQSGMTPDQVRARLRAEGYPEDLLDPYLGTGSATAADSMPGEDVFSAVQSLGITDDQDLDSLRVKAGLTPARRAVRTNGARVSARDGDSQRGVASGDESQPRQPKRKARPKDAFDLRLPDTTVVGARGRLRDSSAMQDDTTDAGDQLEIFGLSVFQGETSRFDANAAGPVDANYRLGPGDRLVLVLTGDVEAAYTLDVTRQGFVVIPQVGEVSVTNLTLGQLEDVLYARLGRVYSGLRRGAGATTHFSVSPSRLRSNQVYVIGDVQQPGSYRVSATGTALSALYAAGGPTDVGSLRRVEIRRGGRVVDQLDVYDYLLKGDATHDPRLENGDVVFVPPRGARVELHGEVLRPAIYEMKPGETIGDLVRAAGGFTAEADRHRVQVERIVPAAERNEPGRDRIMLDISSASMAPGASTGIPVADGDIVRVFPVPDRVRSRVTVGGNVWSPGSVAFVPGITLSQALRRAGGLKPDTYLGEVLVSRLRADSTRIQLRTSLRDTTGAATDDIQLQDDDDIRVFSITDFRPTRYVVISGAVKRTGRYPYREGMTLRDLVLMAGGMEERAYLREAEIARLPEDRQGGRLAVTTRVPLDSSYILDRSPEATYAGAPTSVVQAGHAAEVPLQPYDNVLILQAPDWSTPRNVVLTGEVKYPGVYTLRDKSERLSDVIARAGGLTNDGYPDGVVFYRKRNKTGRVGIDLTTVLRRPGSADDLVLQDGDSIAVPVFNGTVTVDGGVNSPTTVAYVRGADIDYYIAAAGGLAPRAQLSRAYVTQPNGKVESRKSRMLLPDGKPEPRAGSKVFVPLEDPNEKHDYAAAVQIAGSLASVLASLLAAIAISKR